ncbi:MAG: YciI family protein [Candidatus Obscuribacterales bacterium]|nr:YciI family protein [Candidatus Obscuribacterales bacterium]
MQFLLTGRDGKDKDALDRRLAARPAHLERAEKMRQEGTLLMGAALLSPEGQMIGSIMVLNFPSADDVEKYLADEPYVIGNVWQEIVVQDIAVAPHFMPNAAKA